MDNGREEEEEEQGLQDEKDRQMDSMNTTESTWQPASRRPEGLTASAKSRCRCRRSQSPSRSLDE